MVRGGPIRFVVVGDATLDVTVRAGTAPEAGGDVAARIAVGPGGQGANLAVRLARRGATVRLVTAIGDDAAGSLVRAALAADGVDLVPLVADRTGVVVALVSPDGERAMLSDRVSFELGDLSAAPLADAQTGADWIHVSGYPLADERSGEALARWVAARPKQARCSVGGGSFALGSPIAERLRRTRPDLLLFDRGEGLAALDGAGAAGPGTMGKLALALHARYRAVAVISDGPNPVIAATADDSLAQAFGPVGGAVPAVDSTGAGDALAAGIIGTLAGGPWPPSRNRLRRALAVGVRLGAEVADVVGAQARVPSEDRP